jgi:GT2 family glycosyltransferase
MIPEEKRNKVSIIVVNWNGERFLKDCLGALSGQSYDNREIMLVDNGSSDDSVRLVNKKFSEVRVVVLRKIGVLWEVMRLDWELLKEHT